MSMKTMWITTSIYGINTVLWTAIFILHWHQEGTIGASTALFGLAAVCFAISAVLNGIRLRRMEKEDECMSECKESPSAAESEWAEINAEAEQSMFDGFVGKVFVWIRREWKCLLTTLLIPLLSFGYEYYLYWMEFPVVPEIITAEEFHLLVTYADEIKAELPYALVDTKVKSGNRTLSTYSMYDIDADGTGDVYVSLLQHGPLKARGWRSVTDADGNRTMEYFEVPWEPKELEVDSGIFRVHVLDVLMGKEDGFGVSAEDIYLYDNIGWLHMIVNRPEGSDHAEFRAFIEEMLQIAEAAMAAEAEGG